jgi:hypothetical protein
LSLETVLTVNFLLPFLANIRVSLNRAEYLPDDQARSKKLQVDHFNNMKLSAMNRNPAVHRSASTIMLS